MIPEYFAMCNIVFYRNFIFKCKNFCPCSSIWWKVCVPAVAMVCPWCSHGSWVGLMSWAKRCQMPHGNMWTFCTTFFKSHTSHHFSSILILIVKQHEQQDVEIRNSKWNFLFGVGEKGTRSLSTANPSCRMLEFSQRWIMGSSPTGSVPRQ